MQINYVAITHVGARPNQEDAMLTPQGVMQSREKTVAGSVETEKNTRAVFAVCDGVGGAEQGEAASLWVAEHLQNLAALPELNEQTIVEFLANLQKTAEQEEKERFQNGATTVAGIVFEGEEFLVFNLGDSRVYLLDSKGATLLTRDHSLVQKLVEDGVITEEDTKDHPLKNIIYLGIGPSLARKWTDETRKAIKVRKGKLAIAQMLFVCSDGLYGQLDVQEIPGLLANDPIKNSPKLLEKILQKDDGDMDNISYVVIAGNG